MEGEEKKKIVETLIDIMLNENRDSLEIGSASKGGVIKLYHSFDDMEGFMKKVETALEVRRQAQLKMKEEDAKAFV